MKKNTTINYELFIQNAVRAAIRDLLASVAKDGLPGKHYFYIDFLTQYPGVEMPDHLRMEYPEDMTIAIQHEYWDLTVEPDHFSVILAFDEDEEKLAIPYNAILKFADPSVDFGVEFSPDLAQFDEKEIQNVLNDIDDRKPVRPVLKEGETNIVTLDSFRKK